MERLLNTDAGNARRGVGTSLNGGDIGGVTRTEDEESPVGNEGGDAALEVLKCWVCLGILIEAELEKRWDFRPDGLVEGVHWIRRVRDC